MFTSNILLELQLFRQQEIGGFYQVIVRWENRCNNRDSGVHVKFLQSQLLFLFDAITNEHANENEQHDDDNDEYDDNDESDVEFGRIRDDSASDSGSGVAHRSTPFVVAGSEIVLIGVDDQGSADDGILAEQGRVIDGERDLGATFGIGFDISEIAGMPNEAGRRSVNFLKWNRWDRLKLVF